MFLVDSLILVAGILLLLGIASSKFSARFGVPVLVLFLGLGMLAGSEGIGGIAFQDYGLAHAIGTIALAIILFDGGLSTPMSSIRSAWKPSLMLATLGVLITALVTGAAAAWLLEIPLIAGMLLGSIVGSTDAAAVFAVLRSGGVSIHQRLAATLEIESGSNDPMAVFLTVGFIQVLTGQMDLGLGMASLFANQLLVGTAAGCLVGFGTVWLVNKIHLDAAGLYPILVTACGFLAYALAAVLGGSGFLSIYLAGIIIGNSRIVFQRGIFLFHDAAAWLSQITMFVVLGLTCFPSRLLDAAPNGLLIAAVLIFVARPIAVLLCLSAFRFNWRELAFISWVGLKGAVPITLATFPLLFNVPQASLLFDIVFFIVLVSAVIQGWSLPTFARQLKLEIPLRPAPPVSLELSSLRHVEGDIVDYLVASESRAAGRKVRELALPEGVVIALIARGPDIIPPHGDTRIHEGDHVIVVLRPGTRALVDRIFARQEAESQQLPASLEFPLRATVTIGDLEEFYGIELDAPVNETLDFVLRERLGAENLRTGSVVRFGPIALTVRGLTDGGTIDRVGMVILPPGQADSMELSVPQPSSGESAPR